MGPKKPIGPPITTVRRSWMTTVVSALLSVVVGPEGERLAAVRRYAAGKQWPLVVVEGDTMSSMRALKKISGPHGFNIGVNIGRVAGAGIERHVHFHLVPRWNGDTNFMPVLGETKIISEDLKNTCMKLRKQFAPLASTLTGPG